MTSEIFEIIRTKTSEEIKSFLKQHPEQTDAIDENGQTVLLAAVSSKKHAFAATLLNDYDADTEAKDKDGNTALMIAAAQMDREMMALLLKNKANDTAVNNAGKTPLTIIEDEGKRSEIADFIKDQKLRFSLFSINKINKTSLEENSESRVTQTYDLQSPKYEAALILAEYYKLKYGIKIAVLDRRSNPDEIFDFVRNKSDANFQFGVIHYGQMHNVGDVFEKSGDRTTLVSLDSSPSHREEEFYLEARQQLPDLNIFSASRSNELQVDGRCATHAFSMTKDALRLKSTTQEFERAATIISTKNGLTTFSKFPPKLLKYSETSRSVQGVDQEESVLRSSADKPEISLSDYRAKHLKTEVVEKKGKEELCPERNFRIYDKGLEFFEKVKKVLDFYEVDQSNLSDFVARLQQSQTDSLANGTFANPVTTQEELNQQTKLHSDHLGGTAKDIPTWSRVGTPKQTSRPTSAIPLSSLGREAETRGTGLAA
jgi:hypothetical protein